MGTGTPSSDQPGPPQPVRRLATSDWGKTDTRACATQAPLAFRPPDNASEPLSESGSFMVRTGPQRGRPVVVVGDRSESERRSVHGRFLHFVVFRLESVPPGEPGWAKWRLPAPKRRRATALQRRPDPCEPGWGELVGCNSGSARHRPFPQGIKRTVPIRMRRGSTSGLTLRKAPSQTPYCRAMVRQGLPWSDGVFPQRGPVPGRDCGEVGEKRLARADGEVQPC